MIDQKQFSGIMNTDDDNWVMPTIHHKIAFNGRFRGNPPNMRFENIFGTTLLSNNRPAGTNLNLNLSYDPLKHRIFSFNYNSNGLHGIYILDLSTNIEIPLLINGSQTNGDVFGFTISKPITNVNIIYGDDTQGDILFWINSQKLPCQINIDQQLNGEYGIIKKTYLNVIKAPPNLPPYVVYEDDMTVTVNNLRKKLFKFKYRFVFNNGDKSVWSEQSELALPLYYSQTDIDSDPTKNADIAMTLQTGDFNVKKIEVAACQSFGTTFSDFFLVKVFNKSADGITDNDALIYRFYNNEAYNYIDINESIQLFDYVPLEANAQDLLNGNSLIYGGIKEGYPNITDFSTSAASTSTTSGGISVPFVAFRAYQNGQSGLQTGYIHIIVLGSPQEDVQFKIFTSLDTITYSTGLTSETTLQVIVGLQADAVSKGYTVLSADGNNLFIIKTNAVLLTQTTTINFIPQYPDGSAACDWSSRLGSGIVYFDDNERTNGVVYNASFTVQTPEYSESGSIPQVPRINLSIYHRPPDWAYSYSIVRTKNLSKSKLIQWISDRTFKDDSASSDGNQYAYISIENLNQFIKDNPTSNFLAYDFATNDRVRFMKLNPSGGITSPIIETGKDFEIQSQIIDPIINGVQHQGQFIKILLPNTDVDFDFGVQLHVPFADPIYYYNYFIELYSPAQPVANGLDLYYEFGKRYAIGNPTLATRYHQGMLQNQSTDLITPATFIFDDGTEYYRIRKINTGAEFDYQVEPGSLQAGESTIGVDFQSETFDDANILTGNSPLQDLVGFNLGTNNDRWLLKIVTGTFTFNIKGSIIVDFIDFGETFSYFVEDNDANITYLVAPTVIQQGQNIFTFDVNVTLTDGQRLFIFGVSDRNFNNNKTYSQSSITITREQVYTQGVIDQNFSDYFQSAVNSNGRAYIFDPNSAQIYFPTLSRWGLAYQVDTNINQVNRFYSLNFDEIDRAKGDIMKFMTEDRILYVYQKRAVGNYGVYAKYIQDSSGTSTLTTTDDIITKNNIQYLIGNFGVGNHPESVVRSKSAHYFIDPVTGDEVRRAQDGLISLNELYKGQYAIRNLLTQYNKTWTRPNGSDARLFGYYDFFEEQYGIVLQSGINGSNSIDGYNFSFNERRNGYCSFYDFKPDSIINAEEKLYSSVNGYLYVHDNTNAYCNFYGQQFFPSIVLVFNDKVNIKKTMQAIAYQANQIWISPENGDIKTSQPNPQTNLPQISSLLDIDYEINEGLYYAALLRDANSEFGLEDGDYLKGVWIEQKFVYRGSDFAFLYLPYMNYSVSPRNY